MIMTDSAQAPAQAPQAAEAAPDDETIHRMLPIRIVSRVVRGFGRGSKDLGIPTANLACGSPGEARIVTAATATGDGGSTKTPSAPQTLEDLPTGIYWGYCRIGIVSNGEPTGTAPPEQASAPQASATALSPPTGGERSVLGAVLPCAVSIGYNPTYGNATKTIEPHLIAPTHDPRRHASSCHETQFSDFYGQPCRLSVVGYLRPELPFEGLDKLTEAIKRDIAETERLAQQEDPRFQSERDWVESSMEP